MNIRQGKTAGVLLLAISVMMIVSVTGACAKKTAPVGKTEKEIETVAETAVKEKAETVAETAVEAATKAGTADEAGTVKESAEDVTGETEERKMLPTGPEYPKDPPAEYLEGDIPDGYQGIPVIKKIENYGAYGKGTYGYRFNPVDNNGQQVTYWGIDLFDENGKDLRYSIEIAISDESIYIPDVEDLIYEEDINFDGVRDIVAFNGVYGVRGVSYFKAYIRTQDGFEEVEGYEEIPDPVPSETDSKIYGHIRDSAISYFEMSYEIRGNKAVKLTEVRYEWDEDAQDYIAIR